MNDDLTRDQRTMLKAIAKFRSRTNWYKVGRAVVGQLENPGKWNETLQELILRGLVIEDTSSHDLLPVLEQTPEGLDLARVISSVSEEEPTMTDNEIVMSLRQAANSQGAVQLADTLEGLVDGELSHGLLVAYFKRVVPAIPLRILLESGAWIRLGGTGLSDEEFNEALSRWLPLRAQ